MPRSVAVVANKPNRDWEIALRAVQTQYLSIASFRSISGVEAFEVDGSLEVVEENLGFGRYSGTDRALLFPASIKLPTGQIQVEDPEASISSWTVYRDGRSAWIIKDRGVPQIAHDAWIPLIRSFDGRIVLRRSFHGRLA